MVRPPRPWYPKAGAAKPWCRIGPLYRTRGRLPGIAVALPAYNEAESLPRTIPPVVAALRKVTDDFEIVVVDDGSRDRTADVVRELSRTYPEVRLVPHEENLGYGAAVWTGITSGQKDFIFFTDADGQFDIEELIRF